MSKRVDLLVALVKDACGVCRAVNGITDKTAVVGDAAKVQAVEEALSRMDRRFAVDLARVFSVFLGTTVKVRGMVEEKKYKMLMFTMYENKKEGKVFVYIADNIRIASDGSKDQSSILFNESTARVLSPSEVDTVLSGDVAEGFASSLEKYLKAIAGE